MSLPPVSDHILLFTSAHQVIEDKSVEFAESQILIMFKVLLAKMKETRVIGNINTYLSSTVLYMIVCACMFSHDIACLHTLCVDLTCSLKLTAENLGYGLENPKTHRQVSFTLLPLPLVCIKR